MKYCAKNQERVSSRDEASKSQSKSSTKFYQSTESLAKAMSPNPKNLTHSTDLKGENVNSSAKLKKTESAKTPEISKNLFK